MTTTVLGCDTASVDGNAPPNYPAARRADVEFTYLRKCEHVYADQYYARDAGAARSVGIVVGAYLMPSWATDAAKPKVQVAAFKKAGGEILPGKDLPPALDVESGMRGGFMMTKRSKPELIEMLRQLVLEMQDAFGCRPMIYTAQTQWWDLGCPGPDAVPWITECPLWLKTAYPVPARSAVYAGPVREPHFGDGSPEGPDADPQDLHRIPDPWRETDWWLHQIQGDALRFPGFSATVDVDRMRVTQRGDQGPHVKWLQRRLTPYGVTLPADGDFGPATESAVRAFQTTHGLSADGVVGPRTFAAIAWGNK